MERKTISKLCYTLLISILAMLFAASIMGAAIALAITNISVFNSVLILSNAVGLIILYFLYKFLIKDIPSYNIEKEKLPLNAFILLFLSCIGISTLFAYVGIGLNMGIEYIITGATQSLSDSNILADVLSDVPVGVTIFYAVLIGPFLEELIFRKLLISKLRPFGYVRSIVVSAVLFGAYHMNFEQFFYATFIGIILGAVYYRTGEIKYTIVLHMLINFSSVFTSIILVDYTIIANSIYLCLNLFGIIAFFAFCIKWLKKKPEETPLIISAKDTWCNLGMIIYLIFCIGTSVVYSFAFLA
ncbi:MAG: lysostaphin resistance A-like protein [Suipraeoptans sp.]